MWVTEPSILEMILAWKACDHRGKGLKLKFKIWCLVIVTCKHYQHNLKSSVVIYSTSSWATGCFVFPI